MKVSLPGKVWAGGKVPGIGKQGVEIIGENHPNFTR